MKNIYIYNVAYKTSYGVKPLCVIFDKREGYSRETRMQPYSIVIKNMIILDRVRYLIVLQSKISFRLLSS